MINMQKGESLVDKWQLVLESSVGRPIKSHAVAGVIATLLENQTKLNKGYMYESAQVTSDVAVYQQYSLPLIRRQFPELLAMNVVSVIPTTTPQGIYFALRYLFDDAFKPATGFRANQKQEMGYDLNANYSGDTNGRFTTNEGELRSLYLDDNAGTRNDPMGGAIKTASIKVIKGSVIVGTRAIKTHYTLELQQDLASVHGQDIEALMLEALQYEIQQEIDREILAALKYVATNVDLGGEPAISIEIKDVQGEWAGQILAGGVANAIITVAQKIAISTRMGSGNFAICSPDVVAALSTLNSGIYNAGPYAGMAIQGDSQGSVAQVGSLQNGAIAIYRDIFAGAESYALVGFKGGRQGESGIIFMPYIPYIFTKTAGQDDGSPRLIVKSRYAIVANLLGSGQFYRKLVFKSLTDILPAFTATNAFTASDATITGVTDVDGTNGPAMGGFAKAGVTAADGDL